MLPRRKRQCAKKCVPVNVFRNGFRLVVFSVIIMIVVLFFRRGIMGDLELPDLLSRRRRRRKTGKGGGSNG